MEEGEGAAGGSIGFFQVFDAHQRRSQIRFPLRAGSLAGSRWKGLIHPDKSILSRVYPSICKRGYEIGALVTCETSCVALGLSEAEARLLAWLFNALKAAAPSQSLLLLRRRDYFLGIAAASSRAMRPSVPTANGKDSAFQLPSSNGRQFLPSSREMSEPLVPTAIQAFRGSDHWTAER